MVGLEKGRVWQKKKKKRKANINLTYNWAVCLRGKMLLDKFFMLNRQHCSDFSASGKLLGHVLLNGLLSLLLYIIKVILGYSSNL